MTDGPTDIDILMSRIEEINHQQPPLAARDIDALIAYHRHNRARKAAGHKVERATVDISGLVAGLVGAGAEAAAEPRPPVKKLSLKRTA